MKVTVFGTGYVGLVTGTCLAEMGNQVVCVDVDSAKIDGLNNGQIPIFEPGLTPMVVHNHQEGRLKFTTDAKSAVQHGDIIFIAVGTPPDEDGSADLQYVLAVANTIGQYLTGYAVVVNKSTVPVGTADKVEFAINEQLKKLNSNATFDVVSNPEFLKEGDAVKDCMRPDRIIIGSKTHDALEHMKRLYAPFNRNHDRIVAMDVRSAELTKYAANAMLATKISFMNEMANIAERVGADIEMVRHGIGSDPRIGYSFIYPGAGYGGSCFPKDVQALERTAKQYGYRAQILEAVEAVNDRQKDKLFEMIQAHFTQGVAGKTFAVWGLSFKPNTDDMRAASSRNLLASLWAAGAHVQAFDPEAMHEAERIFGTRDDLLLTGTANAALHNAHVLIVVTEWKNFQSPDFAYLKTQLIDDVIFDGRNIYDPEVVEAAGLAYYGIGRGRSISKARNS